MVGTKKWQPEEIIFIVAKHLQGCNDEETLMLFQRRWPQSRMLARENVLDGIKYVRVKYTTDWKYVYSGSFARFRSFSFSFWFQLVALSIAFGLDVGMQCGEQVKGDEFSRDARRKL